MIVGFLLYICYPILHYTLLKPTWHYMASCEQTWRELYLQNSIFRIFCFQMEYFKTSLYFVSFKYLLELSCLFLLLSLPKTTKLTNIKYTWKSNFSNYYLYFSNIKVAPRPQRNAVLRSQTLRGLYEAVLAQPTGTIGLYCCRPACTKRSVLTMNVRKGLLPYYNTVH